MKHFLHSSERKKDFRWKGTLIMGMGFLNFRCGIQPRHKRGAQEAKGDKELLLLLFRCLERKRQKRWKNGKE